MLTAYDYCFSSIIGGVVDIILVGDSLGNVVLGYDSTKHVSMADMVRHTKAVRNGTEGFIVADMPYGSDSEEKVVENAKLLLDVGADAVKVEGKPSIVDILVKNRINVVGHIGHLPQTALKPEVHSDDQLLDQAIALEKAGCFAIVLEMVKSDVAKEITDSLSIPTIGIGAGKNCDGQVLVLNDMLGLFEKFKPKFVKRFGELGLEARKAVSSYVKDVKSGDFPGKEQSFE